MLRTTPQSTRIKKTNKISSFLKSCPPKKALLLKAVTTENSTWVYIFSRDYLTRGAEVDCVCLKEGLAGVGGPDDQLVAGVREKVLQHGGFCSWVDNGKYDEVTEKLNLIPNNDVHKKKPDTVDRHDWTLNNLT